MICPSRWDEGDHHYFLVGEKSGRGSFQIKKIVSCTNQKAKISGGSVAQICDVDWRQTAAQIESVGFTLGS